MVVLCLGGRGWGFGGGVGGAVAYRRVCTDRQHILPHRLTKLSTRDNSFFCSFSQSPSRRFPFHAQSSDFNYTDVYELCTRRQAAIAHESLPACLPGEQRACFQRLCGNKYDRMSIILLETWRINIPQFNRVGYIVTERFLWVFLQALHV